MSLLLYENDVQSINQVKKDRNLAKKQSGNRTKTLKSIDRYENNSYNLSTIICTQIIWRGQDDCDELFGVT